MSKRTLDMLSLCLPVMRAGGEGGEGWDGRSEHELVFPDFQVLLSWVRISRYFLIAGKSDVERCLCLVFVP